MGLKKPRILRRIAFNRCERFSSIWDACGITKINKAFVGKAFVESSVDREPPNTAVKYSDGKIRIWSCELRIANRGFQELFVAHRISNSQFEIRNPKFKGWWRRRDLNSDPRSNVQELFMLSHFSFLPDKLVKICSARVSEVTRPRAVASPTLSRLLPRTERAGQ